MAYCRFSSNHWNCDVYVYESDFGFEVHVAKSRHVSEEDFPFPPENLWDRPVEEIMFWLHKEQVWLNGCTLVPIGLSRDGEDFDFATPQEAADFLKDLQNEGYLVPDTVIDVLEGDLC
ncbi:hypothetical protein [Leptospirillum ferriphilum]|uniref:Uncharacterized protein n=1 Tax=Leptospirillum ferriphilum TaxID=178606 RepID=A0A2I2MFJ7_9BACT|nr:hypothetical protein [Leptospirillum ferriphilum]